MNGEEGKITSVEKSVRIEDPKRVEMGKRLAKISKQKKEKRGKEKTCQNRK